MADKSQVMEAALDRYDVKYNAGRNGEQTISCPHELMHNHGDKNPSARVNLGKGVMYCMGCGLRGDGYNIIMAIEDVDFVKAQELLGKKQVGKRESTWII